MRVPCRRAWPVVLALLPLLAALPPALAAPAAAELRVDTPLALSGDVALGAAQGLLALPALQSLDGPAERLNITLTRVRGTPEGSYQAQPSPLDGIPPGVAAPVPLLGPKSPDAVRYLEVEAPLGLAFALRESGARALLAVGPFDHGTLAWRGGAAQVREGSPRAAGALAPEMAPASGAWLAAEGAGQAAARGTVRGHLEGLAFVVHNASASLQVDATRAAGWVATLRWSGADLAASSAQPFTLLAPRLDLRLDGALEAPRAWGGVQVERDARGARGDALVARGAMDGALAPGGGTVRMRVQGELAYLALGEQRQDYAQVAAAGAGLAVASALAYRVLAVPLYARIAPAELLDNDVRRRVHGHVAARPGADVKSIAQAVGVSWSTAAYHLQRLEREGVLVSRRAGRSKAFFLNGGAGQGLVEAMAALQNPSSLAIAELVARRPGLMQKEIGAALALPPSTVSWHMRRLRELGVVAEARKWRRAEYAAGPLWGEVARALPPAALAPPALPPAGPAPDADARPQAS